MIRCRLLVAVLLVASLESASYANGYRLLGLRSTKAIAMGEAFIVQADDPSAIAFNPAGLGQLNGSHVRLEGTLCNQYTKWTSPSGGQTENNESRWQLVPAAYASTSVGITNMAMGFGISLPNGLASEWSKDGFARYVATYSDLMVIDFSPALGVKLNDHLLLGAGLDYYYSRAKLQRMVDVGLMNGMPGAMDMESTLKGDGDAWGFNAGVIYHVNPRHGFALTYRLPYTIDYDGDITVADVKNDITADIDYPAVIVAGYAYKPVEQWKFEVDVDWTDWDAVGDIVIKYRDPVSPDVVQAQELHSTFAFKAGVEHQLSEVWALRLGYIYNENATAEATWRPSMPDTDTHFLTGGFGFHKGPFTVDGALQFVFYETRTIVNDVDFNKETSSSSIDGKYETFAPCVSLAAGYQF
ncbi:MAG: outer membrane protein transport protein [Lentisphaerota bacterium]